MPNAARRGTRRSGSQSIEPRRYDGWCADHGATCERSPTGCNHTNGRDDAYSWSSVSDGQTKTLLTARTCGDRSHLGTSSVFGRACSCSGRRNRLGRYYWLMDLTAGNAGTSEPGTKSRTLLAQSSAFCCRVGMYRRSPDSGQSRFSGLTRHSEDSHHLRNQSRTSDLGQ